MKIEIKRATAKDLSILQTFNKKLFDLEIDKHDPMLNENWTYSKVGENYFKNAINNDFVAIAFADNKPVGYLAGCEKQLSYWKLKLGELDNMWVEQEYRKHGIGKMLFNDFKAWLKTKGISNIRVTASWENKSAIEFYHKIGFYDFDLTLHCETNP